MRHCNNPAISRETCRVDALTEKREASCCDAACVRNAGITGVCDGSEVRREASRDQLRERVYKAVVHAWTTMRSLQAEKCAKTDRWCGSECPARELSAARS